MKLKAFVKVDASIKTYFTVFHDGDPVENFCVDYADPDIHALNRSILHRMEYEKMGAEVVFIDSICNSLRVTIKY